ncbi:hypothetical protein OS493_006257 [Desmophyllum pertusum]|uniref:Uncharacterized protein n=1 Tax=Desmophyllum pertusum TaxID=174260 RepID=A0A9X0A4G8_9CNID|nr:hypothetical protein OS493_006257 [Desmophyllum pertusum]
MLGEEISVEDELEISNTGVVVAIAKRDKSNSTVFARALDNDHNGEGTIFFLCKLTDSPDRDKSFIWSNEDVSKENLSIGSIVRFKRSGDESIHFSTVDIKPQDVTAIQMHLDYGEGAFLGTKDAFPSAKISPHKLLYMEDLELCSPSIAAISMKKCNH